jgi:two-component system sensor histidine kinase HydH
MTISMSVLPLYGDMSREKNTLIVTFEDITEKEKMREELIISRQLAELGEVAAKVAHDVRNPLNAIEGGIHYLISKYKEDAEIQNISNLISNQVDRLNNVTSDLLKVSKPMVPNFIECNLNQLIEESISYLLEEISLAGIGLEKDYEEKLPSLCLDYNQIQRVIINLMENAIEATPEGGTVTLRTRFLNSGKGAEERVELSVQDTGPGIPADIMDSVFKPFFTTKLNGTGLGLAIVRQIISHHQGEVKIRNREPGPGTEVLLHLPFKMESKNKSHAYSAQHTRHR